MTRCGEIDAERHAPRPSGETNSRCPGGGAGKRGGKPRAAIAAGKRKATYQGGIEAMQMKYLKSTVCRHVIVNGYGMCKSGLKCKFKHDGDFRDFAKISCNRPRNDSGWCDAYPNCVYWPCVQNQIKYKKAKQADPSSVTSPLIQ